MSVTVYYKGVDITSYVDIEQCIHDMYAERHGDTLLIKFSDKSKLWDKWGPTNEDKIKVTSGNATTGTMYVKKIEPMAGYYQLRASSLPASTDVVESESWDQITKLQLAKDLANKHGLTLKTYGVTDRKFYYLRQSSKRDLDFLEDLCVMEGDAFLVFDECLILYNESYMEGLTPAATIALTGDNEFSYEKELLYSGCTVTNGTYTYTYLYTDSYGYVPEVEIPYYIASTGDAERYAKNLYKFKNKNKKSGYFYTKPVTEAFAAGSLVKITTEAASSFDGTVFITHLRNDFTLGKSKIFFRVPED